VDVRMLVRVVSQYCSHRATVHASTPPILGRPVQQRVAAGGLDHPTGDHQRRLEATGGLAVQLCPGSRLDSAAGLCWPR
jgi:hypothetical protein